MLRRFAIAVSVVAGCSHAAQTGTEPTHVSTPPSGDAKPVGLEDDLPTLAARGVAMYQAIATLLAEPSTDCAAVATKLGTIEAANDDGLVATAKVLHAGNEKIKQLRAALEPHQAELDASAQAIAASATMKSCANDAGFAAAIDHLLGEP